jgi:hypothetical protein
MFEIVSSSNFFFKIYQNKINYFLKIIFDIKYQNDLKIYKKIILNKKNQNLKKYSLHRIPKHIL